uniref:GIY-YIG domain-containing protein n=1 Tax=Orbilia brochopaga TaxID=3140254 RepID=A0A4Y5MZB2_9PEZI|nr:hypothetical protein [Drechslerella brochopaga]
MIIYYTFCIKFYYNKLLEPCAGKLASTILNGGKLMRAYLSWLNKILDIKLLKFLKVFFKNQILYLVLNYKNIVFVFCLILIVKWVLYLIINFYIFDTSFVFLIFTINIPKIGEAPKTCIKQVRNTCLFINLNQKLYLKNYSSIGKDPDNSNTEYDFEDIYAEANLNIEFIIKENKGKSGVYCWINKNSGKKYIGSSVDLSKRFKHYFSNKYLIRTSKTSLINKALLKYGYSAFKLIILEYCEPSSALEREQYYINRDLPEYNILKVAGSSIGFKRSEETRNKISNANKGRVLSAISRAKISASKLGSIRSEKAGIPSQKILVIDILTNETKEFESIGATARYLNINQSTISNYLRLNQKKPYKKRYIFKKIVKI